MDWVYLVQIVAGLGIAAIIAGFMAGLLGIGGGLIVVPTLLIFFDMSGVDPSLSMHMAVGSSLGLIVFTSFASARSHYKYGNVENQVLRSWGIGIALGAVISGLTIKYYTPQTLALVFAVVGYFAAYNFLRKNTKILAKEPPKKLWTGGPIGFFIAYIAAMMGIGGGTLAVPAMSACALPIHRAVGTSAAFNFMIALCGSVGFIIGGLGIDGRPDFSLGYVNLLVVLIMFPLTMSMAPLGAKVANKLKAQHLRIVFALFLIFVASRMLYKAIVS